MFGEEARGPTPNVNCGKGWQGVAIRNRKRSWKYTFRSGGLSRPSKSTPSCYPPTSARWQEQGFDHPTGPPMTSPLVGFSFSILLLDALRQKVYNYGPS